MGKRRGYRGGGKLFATLFCCTAVPFYFVAAGFFLGGHVNENGWWLNELNKRLRTILVPYVMWCTLGALLMTVPLKLIANFLDGQIWSHEIGVNTLEWWVKTYGLNLFEPPRSGELWFVRTLFFLFVCAPILVWPLSRKVRGLAWLLVLWALYALFYLDNVWDEDLYCLFSECGAFSLRGIFYFSLGLFLRLHGVAWNSLRWRGVLVLCLGALLLLARDILVTHKLVNISKIVYAISVPLALYGLWTLVPKTKWPRWLTSAAFPVYVLHYRFVLAVIVLVAIRTGMVAAETSGALPYLMSGILAFGISLVLTFLLRRLFPRVAAILFGGR